MDNKIAVGIGVGILIYFLNKKTKPAPAPTFPTYVDGNVKYITKEERVETPLFTNPSILGTRNKGYQ